MSDVATSTDLPALLASLRESIGDDAVQTAGLERFTVDGLTPAAAVFPGDEAGVATVLARAAAAGAAVVPVGSGQHLALGNAPRRYTIALSLARLSNMLEHEPADLTAAVEAGMTLQSFQQALAPHGQWLPVDAPPTSTIGGILASGAAGPCRHRYGAPRDFLIGVSAVLADGRAVKSGGRVVKNVAGYDMGKLYTGSLGTLAVITRATFKLAPLPAARALAVIAAETPAAAAAIGFDADDRGLVLEAVEIADGRTLAAAGLGDGKPWAALLRICGSRGAIERSLAELATLAPPTNAAILVGEDEARAWTGYLAVPPATLVVRLSVLPSDVPTTLDRLAAEDGGSMLAASLTTGIVRSRWLRTPEEAVALVGRLQAWAAALGGACVVEAAAPAIKEAVDVFGPPRADFELVRRIKEQFDPHGVLSPGRFVGRL